MGDWSELLRQITALSSGNSRTYETTLMERVYNSTYGDEYGLALGEIARFQQDWYVTIPNACNGDSERS